MINRPPIIIIGMHRSGTSLLTRLLEQLGLFVGREKDENNESLFFQELNDWILCQAGTAWDNPLPTGWLVEDQAASSHILEYIQTILKSPLSRAYVGRWNRLRCRTGFGLEHPWGWKDPRNTFTLLLWLKLFPEAKVIHIRRHGVDVAQSLKRRNDEQRKKMQEVLRAFGTRKKMPPFGLRAVESPRCLTLEGSFSLWEEYMLTAAGHVGRLGAQATELAYEDLLTESVPILRHLADFCGLESSEPAVDAICADIQPNRASAYREDEEQRVFAASVAERLKVFGY